MATASALDLARLAIVFDTTSAPIAISAMQQVVAQSRQVGQAVDQTAVKQRQSAKATQEAVAALNQLNVAHAAAASGYKRGTTEGQAYTRTVQEMKAALDAEARAASAVAAGHHQRAAAIGRLMAASRDEYSRGAISAQQYATRLGQLQVEMGKVAGAQTAMLASAPAVTREMTLLTGAFGGFFGVLGFQGLAAMTQFATFIVGLPGDLAHAGDQLERFNARMTFAFRGSADAARLARQDIISIARESGVPYSQVSQGYGDLAIAGRGPGLSRDQIGGLTGAFSLLGQMTGSDNASTGRAMWQFQQALALGRLTSQDYRFMATNMPAIDDALAAGLGVDVNTIPGRISRGEIDANRMVEALIRGVDVLKETAGGLPEVMERSRGRIQTNWELLLSNMEARIRSSEFYQGAMNSFGQRLGASADWNSGNPEDRLNAARYFGAQPSDPFTQRYWQNQIRELEAQVNDPSRVAAGRMATMAEDARERGVQRRAMIGRGNQAADMMASIELQRADLEQTIRQLEQAIGAATQGMSAGDLTVLRARDRALEAQQEALQARGRGNSREYDGLVTSRRAIQEQLNGAAALPAEDVNRLTMALSGARAQLARLVYAFDRMTAEADEAERDLARFGAGGGFDIAQSARGIMANAAAQGRPVGMDRARALDRARAFVLRQRFIGAENELGSGAMDLARRQIVVDAAGLDAAGRRRAELDAFEDEFRGRFGPRSTLNGEQAARVDQLASEARRQRAERFAQDDVQALRERERADRERLESLRAQLVLGVQLGQVGRIATAQAERERDLRRQFPAITQELIDAERQRIAELIRANEELDLQQRQYSLLVDAAATAGSTISGLFSAAIYDGVRHGTVRAETVLDVLADSAARVADNLMRAFLAPYERQATDFFAGSIESILPSILGGGDIKFGPTSTASPIPGFASGVQNFSGGWALIGEGGPELLKLPQGASVYSNSQSRAMMGPSPVSVQVFDQRSNSDGPGPEIEEGQGPDGEKLVRVIIRDTVRSDIQSGAYNNAMRSKYGAGSALKSV